MEALTECFTYILLVHDIIADEPRCIMPRDIRAIKCSIRQQLSIKSPIPRMIDVFKHPSIEIRCCCIFDPSLGKNAKGHST
jgi:hypothetical protein